MRTSCWWSIYLATPRDGSGSMSLAAHGWRRISEAEAQDPGRAGLTTQRTSTPRRRGVPIADREACDGCEPLVTWIVPATERRRTPRQEPGAATVYRELVATGCITFFTTYSPI